MEYWWSVLVLSMDLILACLQIACGLFDNMSFEVLSL